MRPLFVLSCLLACIPALAQPTPKPDEIITQENAFWKSYADGNTAELTKMLQPNFVNVEENIWSRDQVLTFVKKFHAACTLARVTITDPHVSFLTADIATIVYLATETPTCGTHTESGNTNVSTIWVRADGHWLMHLHTEYAIPPK
jgi:hypothetical protein